MDQEAFRFKQFVIHQDRCAMKVGTDGVLLGAWASVEGAQTALDIGTGTGLIAVMLGQRSTSVTIDAVEIDTDSCAQAQQNMEAAPWADRLRLIPSSIQEYAQTANQEYDLILSNPPFFTGGVLSDQQDRNQVRHTIKLSHADLLRSVRKLLKPEGRFCLILPLIEGLRFQELARSYQLYPTKILEVHPRPQKPVNRLLMQLERREVEVLRDRISVYPEEGEDWTAAYKRLTADFYLKIPANK